MKDSLKPYTDTELLALMPYFAGQQDELKILTDFCIGDKARAQRLLKSYKERIRK